MRKFAMLAAGLLPALALCVGVSGCSKEAPKPAPAPPTAAPGGDKKGDAPAPADAKAASVAPGDGVIKGVVKYDGAPPALKFNDLIPKHQDKDVCLKGSEFEKSEQTWLVNKDGGVANVIVFLTASKVEATPEVKKSFEKPAVIDQPHCAFVPHILAMYPAAGQKLEIKNSAPVPHNTKMTGDPLKNPTLPDKNLPPGSSETVTVKWQKAPIRVSCSQHPWMNAQIITFDHPYFAVTKEDGSFEISNVPTGVDMQVNVWHESSGGGLEKATQAEKKSFKSGANELTLKVM
jgi:hypothetical protein